MDFAQVTSQAAVMPEFDASRNGPALWDSILDVIARNNPIFGNMIAVAGGAVRDYQIGLAPKDLDIFIALDNVDQFCTLAGRLQDDDRVNSFRWLGQGKPNDPGNERDYDTHFGDDLVGAAEVEIDGIPCNVVCRKDHSSDVFDLINGFDWSYCQIAYTTHDGIVASPNYRVFTTRQVAQLCHTRTFEQSIRRMARFNARHPGLFSYSIPYAFTTDNPLGVHLKDE